jgi:tRNA (cytidine/uridine-2'-O-)-methyltransferase
MEWTAQIPDKSKCFLMSSHATKSYHKVIFKDGELVEVFGKQGLSEEVLAQFDNHFKNPNV